VLPFLAFSAVGSLLALLGAITCEATADLNRKLVLQSSHVVVLLALLLAAGSDLRMLAAAVATAQTVRIVGYFSLMRRTLGTTLPEHLRILAPAIGTGLAIAAVGLTANRLLDDLAALPLLGIHVAIGAVVLLLSFRVGPLSGVRRDLAIWLDRASALEKVPAVVRRVSGLSEHT
jgi:hypothetical protein